MLVWGGLPAVQTFRKGMYSSYQSTSEGAIYSDLRRLQVVLVGVFCVNVKLFWTNLSNQTENSGRVLAELQRTQPRLWQKAQQRMESSKLVKRLRYCISHSFSRFLSSLLLLLPYDHSFLSVGQSVGWSVGYNSMSYRSTCSFPNLPKNENGTTK